MHLRCTARSTLTVATDFLQSFAVLVAFGGTMALMFVPKLLLSPEDIAALEMAATTRSKSQDTNDSGRVHSAGEATIEMPNQPDLSL